MNQAPSALEPFTPIVEALLARPLGSAEFEDALECAGELERAEALRQIRQHIHWIEERNEEIRLRLDELQRGFG